MQVGYNIICIYLVYMYMYMVCDHKVLVTCQIILYIETLASFVTSVHHGIVIGQCVFYHTDGAMHHFRCSRE